MSKTLLRFLIVGLIVFAGLGLALNLSHAILATPNSKSAKADTVSVEVTFDGLMVFRKVGGHYEVGVLDFETAPGHEFKVMLGNTDVTEKARSLTSGKPWSLKVINSLGENSAPDIRPRQVKPCNRMPDSMDEHVNLEHVFDFCWIIDMEKEFHGGQKLELIPGKLKPIIQLYNGELYTKFKYDLLERQPNWENFGFIAETIGLRVNLRADERLVLSNGDGEVLSLTPDGERSAGIFNAPPMKPNDADSHFPFYYDLFSNV